MGNETHIDLEQGGSSTHIDIEHGSVTVRIPMLIFLGSVISMVAGYVTFTILTFLQVQTNTLAIQQASNAIEINQRYIKEDQKAQSLIRSDLTRLQSVANSNARSIETLSKRQWEQASQSAP